MYVGIYRFPSQGHDESEDFCTKFDLFPSNIKHEFPLRSILKEDFDAGWSRWLQNDITNSTNQEIVSHIISWI